MVCFVFWFDLVFCFRISEYENTENRTNISDKLNLNVDLFSNYFSIQVHWCIDSLLLHTGRVYGTLCSKGMFTDALSGNSHPRSLISRILHTLSALCLPLCTISTFTISFSLPFVLDMLFCKVKSFATVKSFAKKS